MTQVFYMEVRMWGNSYLMKFSFLGSRSQGHQLRVKRGGYMVGFGEGRRFEIIVLESGKVSFLGKQ